MKYRSKETIQAEQYDGSAESVERIMAMLGRTSGIMNTPDGYMLIDGFRVKKSWFVACAPFYEEGWNCILENDFNNQYEKLD